MAQELDDDLELWLPSEFLTDEDLLTDFKTDRCGSKSTDDGRCGLGSSFGGGSNLSSPVLSAAGMTETESDEDDFMAELNRKVARSTLRDDSSLPPEKTAEVWKLPGSPQSTLCGYRKPVPKGDSNFVSRACSPPDAKDVQRWELLCAAAEEAARMRMIEETAVFYSTKLFGQPSKPRFIPKSQQSPSPVPNFYRNQNQAPTHHTYHQLQAARFQQMKKQQLMRNAEVMGFQSGRRNGLSMSGWTSLQHSQMQQQQWHHPASGTTAVFLGEVGQKKERIGTGVFMPRRYGSNSSTEPRKKSGCSTVLLPDKVVHALNLKLDPIDARGHPKPHGHFSTELDAAALKQTSTAAMPRSVGPPHQPQPVVNQELQLPLEWTY
ncbi:uncharacterized protein LOC127239541 [Andrographis paniculata]|uniref:uncharacterized protein LOC127239541 n=1 Tax=Andrographis paniculata TaxID=175694 RepID=UPI0021E785FC|nr:uncharacterized protein LOC127239541 [Andrographis paniculata]